MKVGIITYHSAYNFGSVLQAYATEQIIRTLGYEPHIINYRIPFQKKYYGIWGYGKGIKAPLKKALMIPQFKDRVVRKNRYEDFISKMSLTKEYNSPYELNQLSDTYDIYLSGSDQTWNIHSNEYIRDGYEYLYPYLLNFTEKKKISYGSSIVNMSDKELIKLKELLLKFDEISCRESVGADRLAKVVNRHVFQVVDPTLLLNKTQWLKIGSKSVYKDDKCPYILYYSIKNYADTKTDIKAIDRIARKTGYKLLALTPLIPLIKERNIINAPDAGPMEFISYINNASIVITDSYHGMLFSINFGKKFYYLRNSKGDNGIRADDILDKLNLQNRIVDDVNDISNIDDEIIYYGVQKKLEELKENSIDFLTKSLKG